MYIDLILFIAYSLFEGVMNGRLFAYGTAHFIATTQADKTNIHSYLVLVRVVVFFIILFVSLVLVGKDAPVMENGLSILLRGASFILVFPFFHEGAYNVTRKLLEPNLTQYTWTYTSGQSTSKINLVFWKRLLMFILGASIYYFTV